MDTTEQSEQSRDRAQHDALREGIALQQEELVGVLARLAARELPTVATLEFEGFEVDEGDVGPSVGSVLVGVAMVGGIDDDGEAEEEASSCGWVLDIGVLLWEMGVTERDIDLVAARAVGPPGS